MPVAYPFVSVAIKTPTPVATRSPGVIAVVGVSDQGAAPVNTPLVVSSAEEAASLFAGMAGDAVQPTPLYTSLLTALKQDPLPHRIYGVRVAADGHAAGLAALEAFHDVTFVALAGTTMVGAAATDTAPATGLHLLKAHVETASASGRRRLGVAMVDPATPRSVNYAADVVAAHGSLRSDVSRMVLVAARGAQGDVAVAAMSALAGYAPQISPVLKPVRGLAIPDVERYTPSEIKALSEAGIIPIIDPELITGTSLHFAEGQMFTADASRRYVDIVRTLDALEFRLKAGMVGLVGDARITRNGLIRVRSRADGILTNARIDRMIDDFFVAIPVLELLTVPAASRTEADEQRIQAARDNREVEILLDVRYGPAVHHLKIDLSFT